MLFTAPPLGEELDVLDLIAEAQQRLRWVVGEPRRWSGSLRRVTQARSIQGSNSIEGYHASLDDVVAAIEGEEPLDASTETREAIQGYRDAMTYVLELARRDPDAAIDASLLRALHFMLMRYDLAKHPGTFRPGAIWVRREEDGEVVYAAPDIDEVPGLVAELVDALAEPSEHPLVDAAMAHLNLVLIHPFSDGNGRMARCVQTLVITRKHLVAPEFSSIEEYLGRNTRAYYDVLTEVAAGSWQPQRDARPWVRFCLTAHHRQLQTIERRVEEAERLWTGLEEVARELTLPMRSIAGLYDAALGMRLRNASYRSSVASAEGGEISNLTASRDLRGLVDAGVLIAHGERRGRSYVAGEPVADLYQRIRNDRPVNLADPFDLVAEHRQGRLFTAADGADPQSGGE